MTSALLEDYELPPFGRIQIKDIEPTIEQILSDNLKKIDELAETKPNSWEELIKPLENIDDRLHKAWSPVSHLNSVMSEDALRNAYNHCLPKLSDYSTQIGQHQTLYEAFLKIQQDPQFENLDQTQKKVITNALRDFKLAGVALPKDKQEEFKGLKKRLSELQSQFQDNIMDATDNWHLDIADKQKLQGIPAQNIILFEKKAKENDVDGYRLSLDYPCFHAVVTYADDRKLRETMYEAFVTRASDVGPLAGKYDNTKIMSEILSIRHKIAKLLDFENYAHYSLEKKMANSVEEVMSFLKELAEKAKPFADKEFETLKSFAKQESDVDDIKPWDVAYFSEKLKKQKFSISQEELRPYFPVNKVLDGMFAVVGKTFGIHAKKRTDIPKWHDDVEFFDIYDSQNQLRGQFYLDLYAREKKRQGAWMDDAIIRRKKLDQSVQVPVAYVTCNFRPGVEPDPALLTHDEVITLFHEFGHALHHMLTKIDHSDISGINGVPWDAVELPSQFLENWCWQKEALPLISSHYQTEEPLPESEFKKLLATKHFMTGMFVVRQLEFALFDFRIHNEFDPEKPCQIQKTLDEVRKVISVMPATSYNRFQHSFGHIFSGGYAAGYYSYLWAEVLSSDAFAKFKEDGLFESQAGPLFLENILEKGGSEEPDVLFKAFRGRAPKIDFLLEDYGLIKGKV